MSVVDENVSTMDPMEKMMVKLKKDLVKSRTVKLSYEIDFNEIKNLTKIGTGHYCDVFRAFWRKCVVGVKMIKKEFLIK